MSFRLMFWAWAAALGLTAFNALRFLVGPGAGWWESDR